MDSSTLPENRLGAPARRLNPGLLALALGGFGIGLTEFVIAGLLTDVADALHVTVPTAGALIWGYALAVVVGAFTVTAVLSRRPPKAALLVLLALFVAGNALTALAPGFGVAMLGRTVTALCHGGFFGIVIRQGIQSHGSSESPAVAAKELVDAPRHIPSGHLLCLGRHSRRRRGGADVVCKRVGV